LLGFSPIWDDADDDDDKIKDKLKIKKDLLKALMEADTDTEAEVSPGIVEMEADTDTNTDTDTDAEVSPGMVELEIQDLKLLIKIKQAIQQDDFKDIKLDDLLNKIKDKVKKQVNSLGTKNPGYAEKLTKNIMSGGLAGGLSLCFVYSLDYARTRLASDMKSSKGGKEGKRQFSGLIDVYRQTLKSDGFVGLYRGFNISFVGIFVYRGFYFGLYDTIMPAIPDQFNNGAIKFCVGYAVTVIAGLMSYPIDTIRRRMMMTSGGDKSQMYKGAIDCGIKIVQAEGFMTLMKGAGANILRGVAGAGVLAGFDELQGYYVKWKYPDFKYD